MNAAVFELPSRLTVATVASVARELRAVGGTGPLAVDGRAVEQVDTAGCQLLVTLARARPITVSPSAALRELLGACGMWSHVS